MSGREVESALHLGLVFQQIPETSTVPVASGETSRKRTADEEPAADVPSASRRRRSANTDPSSYIRPTFPSCCVNGVVEQACLIPAPPGFDPAVAHNMSPPLPPIYGPQVIAPQVHAQLAALPSTSVVHNVTPIAFHVHGPPPIASNYAYFLPNPQNIHRNVIQPLMGLRLPTTPVHYIAQDIPFVEPPLLPAGPEEYPGMHRHYDGYYAATSRPAVINGGNNWDPGAPQYRFYPSFSYVPRAPNNPRVDAVVSRVRVAQAAAVAAAQVGVDPAAAMHMIGNQPQAPPPGQIEYYNDRWGEVNQNPVPMIDGPVAVPTMAAEWVPPPPPPMQGANENAPPAANFHQQFEMARLANGDVPFREWEAAVLHIFDRMAPQMNAARLPPKGMTKNEIDKLKSFRVTDPMLLMEKVCVICQCDFERRDLVRMLPCAHHFHLKCIDKWLKGNRTCPICRQSAVPEILENGVGAGIGGDGGAMAAAAAVPAIAAVQDNATAATENDEHGGRRNNNSRAAAVQVITQVGATTPAAEEPVDGAAHSDPRQYH